MSIHFSDAFSHTGQTFFSPNYEYIASANKNRLIIRNTLDMEVVHIFSCQDVIQKVSWSKDSKLVLCGCFKRSLVQVFLIADPEWKCRIHDPLASIVNCYWAPDSRHVITVADFQLRLTIWSLVNRSGRYISYPKFSDKGICFNNDGTLMAVLRRENCKDSVRLYSVENWEQVLEKELSSTDAGNLAFSHDSSCLIYYESELNFVLNVISITGKPVYCLKNEEPGLGIKNVSVSNSLLGIGGFNERLVLVNSLTWNPITSLIHSSPIQSDDVTIYEEVFGIPESDTSLHVTNGVERSWFRIVQPPVVLENIPPSLSKPNPKIGVSLIEFSFDEKYVATRNDNMPRCVWIWSVTSLKLVSVVILKETVKNFKWSPKEINLIILSGNTNVYFWDLEGASCANIPLSCVKPSRLYFDDFGGKLLLCDKEKYCFCYLNSDN
ncbi:hypothetical protein P9112_013762 [Eukaryota sp. TZLM1-RC]